MKDWRTRMLLVGTWPLDTFAMIKPSVADTAKDWRYRSDFVHNFLRRKLRLRIAHAVHQIDKDIRIKTHLAVKLHCLSHSLHAAFRIAECAFLLRIACSWKNHVRILRRFRHKQIREHEEIKALERFLNMVLVSVRHNRILAENKQSANFLFDCRREHIRCMHTGFCVELYTPRFFKFFNHFRIGNFLITGEIAGHRTHITCALHVVLSAQRIDAAARFSKLSYQHRHV